MDAFRVMANCSPVMIWMTDTEGEITFVNKAYREFFGVPAEDVAYIDWRTLVHPEDSEQCVHDFLEALRSRTGYRGKCRVRDANGEWRWVTSYGGPFFSASGEFLGMVGSSPDVTDQVNAEAALRESEERFRLALQGMPIFVFTTDRNLRYTWIHNVLAGLQRADIIGRRDEELMSEADAAPLSTLKRRVLANGVKERTEFEIRFGGRSYVYDVTVEPLIEQSGAIIGVKGAATEITERKRTEERLRDADRSKAELIAIVAHELRNRLAPIVNVANLPESASPEANVNARAILRRQVTHLIRIVDDLIDVGRLGAGKLDIRKERVTMQEVVHAAVESAQAAIAEAGHELQLRLNDNSLVVYGDPVRLCQVVVNLLTNAAKFTPRGGTINVELDRDENGRMAVLTVRDTGIGLSPDELQQIFGMFEQGRGNAIKTGLGVGLALSKHLVEMHSGTIEARSEGIGRGSEFIVRLPLDRETPTPPP